MNSTCEFYSSFPRNASVSETFISFLLRFPDVYYYMMPRFLSVCPFSLVLPLVSVLGECVLYGSDCARLLSLCSMSILILLLCMLILHAVIFQFPERS